MLVRFSLVIAPPPHPLPPPLPPGAFADIDEVILEVVVESGIGVEFTGGVAVAVGG